MSSPLRNTQELFRTLGSHRIAFWPIENQGAIHVYELNGHAVLLHEMNPGQRIEVYVPLTPHQSDMVNLEFALRAFAEQPRKK
jgi:hypothetical protein